MHTYIYKYIHAHILGVYFITHIMVHGISIGKVLVKKENEKGKVSDGAQGSGH